MKLFAVYIGGRAERATIEVHDMRFLVADSIEETYPTLRREWWGIPESLHLDGWACVTEADGYRVELKPEPSDSPLKLYYVNLGGYDPAQFTELHRNVFVVAESEAKAKLQAVKQVAQQWASPHRDDLYEAEDIFCLNNSLFGHGLYIHLVPAGDDAQTAFICQYKPIGVK